MATNERLGWFPFLFYSTTWVGEVYLRYDAPADVRAAGDLTGKVGRIGSMALISFSIITFVMSVLLPFFVKNPADEKAPGFTPRPPKSIAGFVTEVEKYKPSLITAWTISHCIFASSMIMAPFVRSLRSATIIIAVCGVYVTSLHTKTRSTDKEQFMVDSMLGALCLSWRGDQSPLCID